MSAEHFLTTLQMLGPIDIAIQLAIVIAALALSLLIHSALMKMLGHVRADKSFKGLFPQLLPYIGRPSRWLFMWCGLELALSLMTVPPAAEGRLHHLLYILIIASAGWLMNNMTNATSSWLSRHYSVERTHDNLRARSISTQLRVFSHVVIFIIWMLTAIAIIMTIPHLRTIGVSLFASAGVAGIVIGMAASPALSNLVAGIQLALTQPIRIDDQIVVEGVSGIVEEIDSTYVVVRLWDFRRLIVPLNYFILNRFQNWTHSTTESILATVSLYVDMKTPIEPIREALVTIAKASPMWDGKTCLLRVTDLKDSKMVELHASLSTDNPANLYALQCEIRERLLLFLQRTA